GALHGRGGTIGWAVPAVGHVGVRTLPPQRGQGGGGSIRAREHRERDLDRERRARSPAVPHHAAAAVDRIGRRAAPQYNVARRAALLVRGRAGERTRETERAAPAPGAGLALTAPPPPPPPTLDLPPRRLP